MGACPAATSHRLVTYVALFTIRPPLRRPGEGFEFEEGGGRHHGDLGWRCECPFDLAPFDGPQQRRSILLGKGHGQRDLERHTFELQMGLVEDVTLRDDDIRGGNPARVAEPEYVGSSARADRRKEEIVWLRCGPHSTMVRRLI